MKKSFDYRDMIFKVLWTAIAAGLAFLGAEIASADTGWAIVATPIINIALVLIRQQVPVKEE